MLDFFYLHPLEMARDPSPAAGLLESLPSRQAFSSLVQESIPWRGHRGRTPGPGHSPAVLSAPVAEVGHPVPGVGFLGSGAKQPLRTTLFSPCY